MWQKRDAILFWNGNLLFLFVSRRNTSVLLEAMGKDDSYVWEEFEWSWNFSFDDFQSASHAILVHLKGVSWSNLIFAFREKETVKRHCAVRRNQTKPNQSKLKGESCVPKTTVRYSKCVSDWLLFRMDGIEKTPPISKSVMHKVFWHKTIFCKQSCFSEVTETKALIEKHYYRIDVIQKVLAKKAMEEKER